MRLRWLVILLCAAAALPLCSAFPNAAFIAKPSGLQPQITMPWDQPPPEFKEVEQHGFHAGVKAAINDFNHHREAEPERHKDYQNPHVHRSYTEDYRKGFRRGYNDAMRHIIQSKGHRS